MSTIQMGCRATAATARSDLAGARAPRRDWSWLLRAMQRAADRVLTWHERSRQRHQLECLSDYMLRDIGLTRSDVLAEATKRFWQR